MDLNKIDFNGNSRLCIEERTLISWLTRQSVNYIALYTHTLLVSKAMSFIDALHYNPLFWILNVWGTFEFFKKKVRRELLFCFQRKRAFTNVYIIGVYRTLSKGIDGLVAKKKRGYSDPSIYMIFPSSPTSNHLASDMLDLHPNINIRRT